MADNRTGDFESIRQSLNSLSINVYTGGYVRPAANAPGYEYLTLPGNYLKVNIAWLAVLPESIYWGPRLLTEAVGYYRHATMRNASGWYSTDTLPSVASPKWAINGTKRPSTNIASSKNNLVSRHRDVQSG